MSHKHVDRNKDAFLFDLICLKGKLNTFSVHSSRHNIQCKFTWGGVRNRHSSGSFSLSEPAKLPSRLEADQRLQRGTNIQEQLLQKTCNCAARPSREVVQSCDISRLQRLNAGFSSGRGNSGSFGHDEPRSGKTSGCCSLCSATLFIVTKGSGLLSLPQQF